MVSPSLKLFFVFVFVFVEGNGEKGGGEKGVGVYIILNVYAKNIVYTKLPETLLPLEGEAEGEGEREGGKAHADAVLLKVCSLSSPPREILL